jgi:O-antigen ligase
MSSDVTRFRFEDLLSGPLGFVLTLRPMMPALAMALSAALLVRTRRVSLSLEKGPFLMLSLYGLLGGFFFFMSPEPFVSLYWAALYLAAPFVAWTIINVEDPEGRLRLLMNVNAAIILVVVAFFLAGPLRPILQGAPNPRFYKLPFGLGIQTANGVGRFAGVAALIALARLTRTRFWPGLFWAAVLAGAVTAIAVCESRTSILGIVAGVGLIVVLNRKVSWLIVGAPGLFYLLYKSWFVWRFRGSLETAFLMSGREVTWKKALGLSLQFPVIGHGFHADRLLLEGEHVHMAYLHSLVQSGVFGAALFLGALAGLWWIIARHHLFRRTSAAPDEDRVRLTESIAILGFLSARSFFESTAAFYGVDLLLLIPVMAYLQIWCRRNPEPAEFEAGPSAPASPPTANP